MASAGGDGGNAQPVRGRTQRITIPLPRPLQPGQRVTVRMVPAMQIPGVNGMRVIRPAHAHVHVVDGPRPQQASPQAQQLLRQQQELQQQIERDRSEEQRQREELKVKLQISELPKIEHREEDDSLLSWKPIQVDTPTPPTYNVLLYTDQKEDGQEIYNGAECQCSVRSSLLLPGHKYQFTISASVGNVTGERSPRCILEVPARPPGKPLPPKVGTRSKSSLTLRWNAPQDNGSSITCYELEWDQCKGDWVRLNSDKTKQFKFNHRFLPSTVAEFRIRASNEVGWSEHSDVLSFNTGAAPPSVPGKPHTIQAGANYLNVGWGAANGNGAEVMCYKLEKDFIEGGHGFIPEYNGSDLSCNCSNLFPNSLYKFKVSAKNEAGWSQPSQTVTLSTLADICSPPGTPYLKERATPTSLHVTWSPPTNTGGAEVQSYVLEVDSSGALGGEEMMELYRGPNDNHVMEGLLPGRRYLCQVCALTEAGRGKWSSVAHLRTPATKPSPPPSLCVAGDTTKTSVRLEWGYPLSDGGATITSYCVECRHVTPDDIWRAVATVADPQTFSDHPSTPSTPSHPSLSHTITQLQPGEKYVFRVLCQNSVGASHPSVECPCSTAPGEPDPPSSLEITSLTATSVQLHWKDSLTHGCPVESYEVQHCCSGDGKMTPLSVLSPTCTVSNLHSATSYQARVRALSGAGSSEWSVMITFTTAPSTPSQPTQLTMVSHSPYSMLIAWTSPSPNGAPITAYHVEYGSGQSITQSLEVSPLETQYNMMDLRPSTSYRYRVRAENSVGTGMFGGYGSSSTLPPPPSPPLLTLASATHHTLKLTWGKKTNRAVSYTLQVASRGKQFHEVYSGTAVSHRLTRLQPDTEYVMRIAAMSESGQGAWSDDVTFMTTPTLPPAPTDLVLRQESNKNMKLSWQPGGDVPYSVRYEVQMNSPPPRQDFIQAYKGDQLECTLPVSSYDKAAEARVRCWTVVSVNGRDEQLWSAFSPTAHCQCRLESLTEKKAEKLEELDNTQEVQNKISVKLSPQMIAMMVFVIGTLLTLIVAFILGQYAV